jgi:hypothetical protein
MGTSVGGGALGVGIQTYWRFGSLLKKMEAMLTSLTEAAVQ